MELTIFGTAAAEAWPAPFCRCFACNEARRRGGPNLRSRSGGLIDEDLKVDFSADTVMQMIRSGRDLTGVRTIVFTHQHSDHIVASELEWASGPFTNTPPSQPIAVYGNAEVMQMLRAKFPHPEKANFSFFPPLEPLIPVVTVTGDTLLPLPADHAPGALILRITRANGQSVFWGHDSGLYPEATQVALAEGTPLDIALFDCTYGGKTSGNRGHMGIDGVVRMVRTLQDSGALNTQTKLIATHFSHNGGLMHEELVEAFLPYGIMVAYDGLVVRSST